MVTQANIYTANTINSETYQKHTKKAKSANVIDHSNTTTHANTSVNENQGLTSCNARKIKTLGGSINAVTINNDGDTFSFHSVNTEKLLYQKNQIIKNLETLDDKDLEAVVKQIKDQFTSLKEEIIKAFVQYLNGKNSNESNTDIDIAENTEESGEIQGLPEYWNAENTSNRIIDFATSFFAKSGTDGAEYYKKIRDAIETGFKQAKEVLGDIGGKVGALTQKTYELTMQKLDTWAQNQEITIQDND